MPSPKHDNLTNTRSKATRPPVPRPHIVRTDPLNHFNSAVFLWGSIWLAWLLSMLPWRSWPYAPDILLLVIAFWCTHGAGRIGLATAFIFGMLIDVHDAGPLGQHALIYTLIAYGAEALHRRLLRFELWGQCLHMLPIFVLSSMAGIMVCAWLAGAWPGWSWAISAGFTALCWPFVGWLLLIPQRRRADVEVNSV